MSDNGSAHKITVMLNTVEAEMADLALRMLASMAERQGEAESWQAASDLAARFRNAASVKEWT